MKTSIAAARWPFRFYWTDWDTSMTFSSPRLRHRISSLGFALLIVTGKSDMYATPEILKLLAALGRFSTGFAISIWDVRNEASQNGLVGYAGE